MNEGLGHLTRIIRQACEYHRLSHKELEALLPTVCPLRRLRHLKAAMHSAAELLEHRAPAATPYLLTLTMQILRWELPELVATRPRLEAFLPDNGAASG